MSLLLSVLIPSRGRFDKLLRCIQSWHETASDPQAFEVRVKFDTDDSGSLVRVGELEKFGNVTVLIDERMSGYGSIDYFCTKMADESKAPWITVFNDDAMVYGKGWGDQLREVPTSGFIVQPEINQLNSSIYPLCEGGAFPIVPNGFWKAFGMDTIKAPSDYHFEELRKMHGWQTHFLKGVTFNHERTGTVPA